MTNNVETLQNGVSDVKIQLIELKDNIELSAKEKKNQAENLKNRADDLLRQIDAELAALRASTDADAQEKIDKLEASKDILQEITDLYNSILSLSAVEDKEKEWFFKWIWDRFSEKWQNFKNKDSKEKAKTAWLIVASGIATRWIFSFFSKKKREERRERRRQRREARKAAREERRKERENLPFWERPIGKFVKWTGIWTAAYYISHGIATWKWKLKDFFDWKKATQISQAEDALDEYTEFSQENLEKYKEYESIWENINLMYDQIRETEKNYFWTDSQIVLWEIWDRAKEEKLQRNKNFEDIWTLWLVPYSLDNFYGNVWDMLTYGWVNKYLRSKNIEEYKQKIMGFGADWFNKVMVPFLSGFANFTSLWIVKKDTAQEKMNKYFSRIGDNAQENLDILDLFFRQYTKVLTYMADKKNALAQQCARQVLVSKWYDWKLWPSDPEDQEEMINEAVHNSEWVEENLKNTKYWTFLQSNILWACNILKEESLDTSEMTEELRDVVEGVDKQTEKLIWWFNDNAFVKAESKFNNWEQLDDSDKNGLRKISQNLLEDLWDTTTWSRMYNTFDYVFELLDLKEKDKQDILQEAWLTKCLEGTIEAINQLTAEIQSNPTRENVEKLKNLVWEYTSMKKELAVAIYGMQEAKENKDLWDYLWAFVWSIGTFFMHFFKSVKGIFHWKYEIWNFINIFAWLTVTWSTIAIWWRMFRCPLVSRLWQHIKNAWLFPVTLTEMWLWHTRRWWAVRNRINTMAKTRPIAAENFMKKKILDGVLSPRQVTRLVEKNSSLRSSLRLTWYQNNDKIFWEIVHNIFWDSMKEEANLFIKHYPKARGLVSYRRESIMNWGSAWDKHKFRFDISKEWFAELKLFDTELGKLWNTVQKSYFEYMLNKVWWVEDMRILNDLIKNEDFMKIITENNIGKLKKIKVQQFSELKKSWALNDFLSNKISIDELLERASRIWRHLENGAETWIRTAFNKSINKVIWRLNEVWNPRAVQAQINNLKALRNDASLADDEMEWFIKFIDHWFDGKLLPDLKRLFKISSVVEEGEELWSKMKRLISEGNFDEFSSILRNAKYKTVFKDIPVDDLVKNLESVIWKLWKATSNAVKSAIKWFMKILAKVL